MSHGEKPNTPKSYGSINEGFVADQGEETLIQEDPAEQEASFVDTKYSVYL